MEAGLRVQAAREATEARLKEEVRLKGEALGLTHAQRALVQRGLATLKSEVRGLFDGNTREAIAALQFEMGLTKTGYLTRELIEVLMELGEAERERKEAEAKRQEAERRAEAARRADNEAFARAKSEGTAESYASYLDAYPSGRHAVEARRLRAEAAERGHGPAVGERFRDCETCPEMVVVPSGSFMMGSKGPYSLRGEHHESPVHRVTIADPFAVGVYELTRKEWSWFLEETNHSMGDGCWIVEGGKWVMNSEGDWRSPGFRFSQGDDSHPVVCVNWEDAQAYVQWLSMKTGNRYRLLGESEWEFAARAGTGTAFWWGDNQGRNQANCANHCESPWDGLETAPVGSFLPNAFGLYDVHGNVSEWVGDCYHENYSGAPADGSVWTDDGDCSYRLKRGGSWINPPVSMRSAARSSDPPHARSYNVGFRVASVVSLTK